MTVEIVGVIKSGASNQGGTGSSIQGNNAPVSIFSQAIKFANAISNVKNSGKEAAILDNSKPDAIYGGVINTKQDTQPTNAEKKEQLQKVISGNIFEKSEDGFKYYNVQNNNDNNIKSDSSVQQYVAQPDNKLEINGQIDHFKQGYYEGDCWLLSGVQALAYTKEGAETIKNSISQDENGNVTVNLKGVNENYTFTPDEINKAETRLCEKDDDMRAIELAVEAHRKKEIESGNDKKHSSSDPLGGGVSAEAVYLLTGKVPGGPVKSTDITGEKNFINAMKEKQNQDINEFANNYLNLIEKNPEKYSATLNFMGDDPANHIYGNHTFAVKRVEGDNVILTNPWESGLDVPISRKMLLDQSKDFIFITM